MISSKEKLTQAELQHVLDYDPETGDLTWLVTLNNRAKAGTKAGCVDKVTGYLRIGIQSVLHLAHRLAWFYVKGVWPDDQIDHINHIRLDNRLVNLRVVSPLENQRNQTLNKNNTSGHTGVSQQHKQTRKWRAEIYVKNKRIHLGCFTHQEDAIAARKAAEIKYGFHKNHGKNPS